MKTKYLIQGAMVAAVYVLVTYLVAPFSSGLIQCRVSEALTILPYFTPAAIPGLFIGCIIANLITGAVPLDIIAGSLATLLAAFLTWWLAKRFPSKNARWLAPAPAVIVNAVVVGWLLANVYGVGVPFLMCALYVAVGQIIACYGLGMPLLFLLARYKERLFN